MNAGVSMLFGGLGLFLLGMGLMTDGLKSAAGPALGQVLSSSTATRWRGLLSGILVTALVQSSSAVTVAAIGFVNAGLLSFGQSIWVLFGANVGTTMTGWLVALIGLKIKVEAAALPMVGLGMVLRLSGPETRRGALGGTLAGFGVLFLGIGFMQQAFSGIGGRVDLAELADLGAFAWVAYLLAGLLLTVLMQSSSASLAVVLTLAESGVIPLVDAAAAVIGANVGTTVTALLATLGATANAKRAAMAHVLFNVLTGIVALALLPLLVMTVLWLEELLGLASSPALGLALFHTVFNLLGVILMWPLAARLAGFLEQRFRTREEEVARPRYLDPNVVTVPSLAIEALHREVARLGGLALGAARTQTGLLLGRADRFEEAAALPVLSRAIADFVTRLSRSAMSQTTADALATLLRVQRYYDTCGELAAEMGGGRDAALGLDQPELRAEVLGLLHYAEELLTQLDPAGAGFAVAGPEALERFEGGYQGVKRELLAAAARGALSMDDMDVLLRSFSILRRAVDQAAKAARSLDSLAGHFHWGFAPSGNAVEAA